MSTLINCQGMKDFTSAKNYPPGVALNPEPGCGSGGALDLLAAFASVGPRMTAAGLVLCRLVVWLFKSPKCLSTRTVRA